MVNEELTDEQREKIKEILGHKLKKIDKDQSWYLRNIKSEELTETQRRKLSSLLSCEICGTDKNCQCHRLKRGNKGGKYILSNIQICCKEDHKILHQGEKGTVNR